MDYPFVQQKRLSFGTTETLTLYIGHVLVLKIESSD